MQMRQLRFSRVECFSKFIQLRSCGTELGIQPSLNPEPSLLTAIASQFITLFIHSFQKLFIG